VKLSELYNLVVRLGSDMDPRRGARISSYADTAILYGNPNTEIRKVMVGIDVEAPELLLADRIREKEGLDLVISHHPEGKAYASLHGVMQLQVDLLKAVGVSEALAQKMLEERKQEVERKILPQNHTRPVDAARLLNMPFMCMHTPADNHAFRFLERVLKKEKPGKVQDIVDILKDIPEYKTATIAPQILLGSPRRRVGKVLLEMTGGTEGSKEIFGRLSQLGINTIVGMHLSEEHFKKMKPEHINAVVAGHIASDTLGLNLLLDKLEKKDEFEFISCSGFTRIKR